MRIRTAINIVESHSHSLKVFEEGSMEKPLFEMPVLQAGKKDLFDLLKPDINRLEYERLMHGKYETIEEHGPLLLALKSDGGDGEVFLVNRDEKVLTYYVNYEVNHLKGLGRCATQVVLWRRAGSGLPGVTSRVFNSLLMDKFDAMVSDEIQTPDGQRFWIDRMAEAIQHGWSVGLIDLNGKAKLHRYPGGQSLQQWLTDMNGWGEDDAFGNRLFFISKKAPVSNRARPVG
jgi:hypothetical protein